MTEEEEEEVVCMEDVFFFLPFLCFSVLGGDALCRASRARVFVVVCWRLCWGREDHGLSVRCGDGYAAAKGKREK